MLRTFFFSTFVFCLIFGSIISAKIPNKGYYVVEEDGVLKKYLNADPKNNPQDLTDGYYPAISPNGQFIVYKKEDQPSQNNELWIMDYEGKNKRKLAENLINVNDITWTNKPNKVIFLGNQESASRKPWHTAKVNVMDITTGEVEVVFTYNPTKKRYTSDADIHDNMLLYRIGKEVKIYEISSNKNLVTLQGGGACNAQFSPDGKSACVNVGSHTEVNIYGGAGSDWDKKKTIGTGKGRDFCWSNHSDYITYWNELEHNAWLIDVANETTHQLSTSGGGGISAMHVGEVVPASTIHTGKQRNSYGMKNQILHRESWNVLLPSGYLINGKWKTGKEDWQ